MATPRRSVIAEPGPGLEAFFAPGEEILVARSTDEAVAAIERSPGELARIGRRARERALVDHAGARRAAELLALLERPREVAGAAREVAP